MRNLFLKLTGQVRVFLPRQQMNQGRGSCPLALLCLLCTYSVVVGSGRVVCFASQSKRLQVPAFPSNTSKLLAAVHVLGSSYQSTCPKILS